MKKVWVSLLTMLLACALLTSAVFAEGEGFGAESWEYSEQVETVVEEVEEFELGEDAAMVYDDAELTDEADDEAAFEEATDAIPEETADSEPEPVPVVEEMTDAVDAALASNNSQPSEDFDIYDGLLYGYHGNGGRVVIPNTVTRIASCVFNPLGPEDDEGNCEVYENTTVTSVYIPSSVIEIYDGAFQDCINLKSVTIQGSNLRRIGDGVFTGCSSLTSISLPDSVEHIGSSAFYNCSSLQTVRLPAYLDAIQSWTFEECSSLKTVTNLNSVYSIGKGAFYNCGKLASVQLSEALEEIPDFTFAGCSSLKTISIPKYVNRIGWCAFDGCTALSTVVMRDGLVEICGCAFFDCASLTSITIPGTVKRFVVTNDEGNVDAVFGFSGLKSVTIKEGVKIIPESMFYGCDKLTNVTLPETVTEIGDYAFAECLSLSVLKVSKAVTRIGEHTFEDTPSNLQLQVTCNSAAHKYAKAKGIKYTVSGHTAVVLQAVDATCTKSGLSVGVKCSVCGEILSAQKTVAALGHKQQTYKGYDSTCSRLGLTDSVKCSRCGITITPTKVIPTKAHTKQTVKGYAATYTKAGLSDGAKCSVCGTWITKQTTIARKTYPGSVLAKKGKNGTITVNIGEQFYLTPQFAANANTTVKGYKSSKKSIAAVDGNGLVTPKKAGKATITVTTKNKKKKATVVVKVVDPYKPTGVSITNGKKVTIKVGQTLQLDAVLKPATAQSALTWTSSKKKIATVSKSGLVTAKKKGTTKITVKTKNKKKATITVKVVP